MSDVLVSMEDELMNTRAFAKAVGVAPSSITNFVEQGRLVPAYKEVVSEKDGKKHYKYCFNRSQIETARFIAKRGKTNNQLLVWCLGQNQEEVSKIADVARKQLADEKGLIEINSIAEYCSSIEKESIDEIVTSKVFQNSLEMRINTLLKREQKSLEEQYVIRRREIEKTEKRITQRAYDKAREELESLFTEAYIVSKIRNRSQYLTELYMNTSDEDILHTYVREYLDYMFSEYYTKDCKVIVGKEELKIIVELIESDLVLKCECLNMYAEWQSSLTKVRTAYKELDNEYFKANGVLISRYASEEIFNPDDDFIDKFIENTENACKKEFSDESKEEFKKSYRTRFSTDTDHTYKWNNKIYTYRIGDKYLQEKDAFLKRYMAKEQKKKIDGKDSNDNKLTTLFAIEEYVLSEDAAEFERIMMRVASREFGQVMILNSDLLDEKVKSVFTVLDKTGVLHISLS